MAEDKDDSQKTEEPTPKRLQDARKKGDVAKSQEVAGVIVLATGTMVLALLAGPMARTLAGELSSYLANAHLADPAALSQRGPWMRLAGAVGLVMAAPLAALLVASVLAHVVQTGGVFSAERLKPKLDKLSPVSGFKRVFGLSAAANFFKGLAKLGLVGGAAAAVVWPRRDEIMAAAGAEPAALLPQVRDIAIAVLIAALAVYALIAAADYIGQRQSFMKRQRMSRQDIKDEHKQTEGDPHVRARLRQIRQERAQRRMIAKVPEATVVVTNPTHYAVALKYEQGGGSPAPICVAKGVDATALKIREVAEEHKVPIVEDPPLARGLFATVELDQPIPPEHYQAVAKIIGYVFTLAARRRRRPR
jgi:flagellar biosynthetic protein FlhB